MPDSHFNSGTIPLCHAVLSSIDFFFSLLLLLGHREEKNGSLLLLLLLVPEPRLPTIKVNAGTTLITARLAPLPPLTPPSVADP